jgi:hypothetical protein
MFEPAFDRGSAEADVALADTNRRQLSTPDERVDQRARDPQESGHVVGREQPRRFKPLADVEPG